MIADIDVLSKEWKSKGKEVLGVVVHPDLVARGFIFSIENDNCIYLAVNKVDIDVEIARLIMNGAASTAEEELVRSLDIPITETLCGLPIVRDEEKIMKIMTGVFVLC